MRAASDPEILQSCNPQFHASHDSLAAARCGCSSPSSPWRSRSSSRSRSAPRSAAGAVGPHRSEGASSKAPPGATIRVQPRPARTSGSSTRSSCTYEDGTTKLLGREGRHRRAQRRPHLHRSPARKRGRPERIDDRRSNGDVRLTASDGLVVGTRARDLHGGRRHRPRAGPGRVRARPHDRVGHRHDLRQEPGRAGDPRSGRRARSPRTQQRRRRHGDHVAARPTFARRDKIVRFERGVKAIARRADDRGRQRRRASERRRGAASSSSSCAATRASPTPTAGAGGLQALTGRDIDLKYGADGETLEHALIVGDAVIQLAGEAGAAGPADQRRTSSTSTLGARRRDADRA